MYKISEFIYSFVQFTQSIYCTENNLDRHKPIEMKQSVHFERDSHTKKESLKKNIIFYNDHLVF